MPGAQRQINFPDVSKMNRYLREWMRLNLFVSLTYAMS